MTKFLLKLFVKDYKDVKNPAVRFATGRFAGIIGILCNCLLFLGKMLIGFFTASVSITADALNNLMDAASSVVTLFGFHLAKRPADPDHPYGHGRYEYLAGLAVSALILFVGFELLKTSVSKILHPAASAYSWLALSVLVICMLVKLWMSLFFRACGKRIDSQVLKTAATDSRNDVIATGAVLAGCLFEQFLKFPIDGYMGLAVSVFILYSGIQSAKETISPLLGAQADETLIRELSDMILSHDKIIDIHDLLIHDYGPGQRYASVHAELSDQYDAMVCHEILDHIENEAQRKLNIQLVIHFDPVSMNDDERSSVHETITGALQVMNPALSVHDLRLDRKTEPATVCFDLAIPYSLDIDPQYIHSQLLSKLKDTYQISMQIDRT